MLLFKVGWRKLNTTCQTSSLFDSGVGLKHKLSSDMYILIIEVFTPLFGCQGAMQINTDEEHIEEEAFYIIQAQLMTQ